MFFSRKPGFLGSVTRQWIVRSFNEFQETRRSSKSKEQLQNTLETIFFFLFFLMYRAWNMSIQNECIIDFRFKIT